MPWLVCKIATGSERRAVRWARERGHELYCPEASHIVRPKGKNSLVVTPRAVYPGYVFGSIETDLDDLHAFDAFRGFVSFGGEPPAVPDATIGRLRRAELEGLFNERDAPPPEFRLNALVRVTEGPATSLCGFVTWQAKDRFKLTGGDFRSGAVWIEGRYLELA